MAAQEPATLVLTETGEKISKPLTGKPDKYGQRYFKEVDGEQVEISRGEFKEDRRMHLTVRHRSISRCGHRFNPSQEPRHRNCEMCWFAYLNVNGPIVQTCDEIMSKFGIKGLVQIRGKKCAKNFLKFVSTVAQWKREIKATRKDAGVENGENTATKSN